MLAYLVNYIHAFIPAALIAGMLTAALGRTREKSVLRPLFAVLGGGIAMGGVLFVVSRHHGVVTGARTSLEAVALLAALLHAGAFLCPGERFRTARYLAGYWFTGALAGVAAFSFSSFVAEQALTASAVLNTDLILNIGGILAGILLTGLLIPVTAQMTSKVEKKEVTVFLLAASALLVAQWSADLLLGLMRLEVVELTSARVSIVAKVGKYSYVAPYINAGLIIALSLLYFRKRTPEGEAAAVECRAERRKVRSGLIAQQRWFRCSLACAVVVVSMLLYHDLHASRPPRISTPLQLTPDADGVIRVKTADLADGRLHRFSYVTEDGHVVRFFMLNRSGGKKIGVVYDACMMCGDMGYIQEENEVICIACNVRIFIPSIGKAGGCNPIPLAHAVADGEVRVSAEELDKGAKYFSEVVTVKVKDPVTGKEMVSGQSPHRYEYKGRTYFFESADSLEKFRGAPDTYTGNRQSRYFRAQGYQQT